MVNRWIYVFAGLGANLILGTIYSWSVFRKPLEILLGWGSFESGIPFSIFLLFFAICMPLGGRILKTYGTRRAVFLGALLVGGGWILSALTLETQSPLLYVILFYGVMAGSGVALIYNSTITVSSYWVPERRGLAVGLTVLGFGISPLITAPLANYLIAYHGVKNSFIILGGIYGLILLALSYLMVLPRLEARGGQMGGSLQQSMGIREFTPGMMVRTKSFAGLWLAYVLGTLGGFIAISQAAKFGQEVVRLSPGLAAVATGVFAIFNGLGRPLFGYLADRVKINVVSSISFLLAIAAALLATQASSLTIYIISYSILWLVFGGWLALAPKATSLFFGAQNLSVNYGIVFTAYGASALAGPTLSASLWELLGHYSPVFMTVAALSALGLAVSNLMLKPPAMPERKIPVKAR
ncbi:Oxalate:formate antiporter [Candidatus Calditenuaceae archaeon HR02]|nr:Oxalate:formate antiporter [Candidatus Calditenuaceae archaeon HR02]